ncbi:methylaspartate mutase [Streptomyces sp. M2CJ-2]|uniref:methylaspartate mutase n=1 Tax=Streptomyces sp. M2CJ-2 TaxID=2803948 RepID=UPI001927307F|nr:methylaspartate mutase [Streptomyces sp. M2CJ-2]MBL3671392.1 methylaspartate mutase [Streptomyces sp. M2CJ-2]
MSFGDFVRRQHAAGRLVVQPRMGFGSPEHMRAGLAATRAADATTVGTVTLDSYTRVGDLDAAAAALRDGTGLNGYPLATHSTATTRQMLAGLHGPDFPVQIRHGSARPQHIVDALVDAGLHATEGGPVSYCLPYGRIPLGQSVHSWTEACRLLLRARETTGAEPHLETFGGALLGQLCPPSLLVAVSTLEAVFFHRHGLRSISVSYAQQTNPAQDREAVAALRGLCADLLPGADWHVVVYAYMGLFPRSDHGSRTLLAHAAELAVHTGSERLIVKTTAESRRIPTIEENVAALEHAAATARASRPPHPAPPAPGGNQVHREARALVDAVLDCDPDIGRALIQAFQRGLLDVPYCLHPDNAGRARSYLAPDGRLGWAALGSLPLAGVTETRGHEALTSASLMTALSFVRDTYDQPALTHATSHTLTAAPASADGPPADHATGETR